MPHPPTTSVRSPRLTLDGTLAIGTAWTAVTVYNTLRSLGEGHLTVSEAAAAVAAFAAAWAVLERKRWGRLAMLGIAACTTADLCVLAYDAGARAAYATQAASLAQLHRVTPAAALGLALLSLATLAWLFWRPVRYQFETRKRPATRRLQFAIAALLVALWAAGQPWVATPAAAAAGLQHRSVRRSSARHPQSHSPST